MELLKDNSSKIILPKYNFYRTIDENKNLQELHFPDYRFVYEMLNKSDTLVYVDNIGGVNFIVKLESLKNLDLIINSQRNMGITHSINGPEIIINPGGYSFILNVQNQTPSSPIIRLIEGKKIKIHYIIDEDGLMIKLFTEVFELDEDIIETLRYMFEFSISSSYPRIKYEKNIEYGYLFKISGGVEVIEEVMGTVELLQKWESRDNFDIFLHRDLDLNIFISDGIKNYNFFRNELSRRFQIIENGREPILGRPFLNYKNGLIYFYK